MRTIFYNTFSVVRLVDFYFVQKVKTLRSRVTKHCLHHEDPAQTAHSKQVGCFAVAEWEGSGLIEKPLPICVHRKIFHNERDILMKYKGTHKQRYHFNKIFLNSRLIVILVA